MNIFEKNEALVQDVARAALQKIKDSLESKDVPAPVRAPEMDMGSGLGLMPSYSFPATNSGIRDGLAVLTALHHATQAQPNDILNNPMVGKIMKLAEKKFRDETHGEDWKEGDTDD